MIALVEGAKRQKTPNEIALDILLAKLTIIFLLACVTLLPFSVYAVQGRGRPARPITVTVLVALLVCLIPTTIGGLLSAIRIAGMDRLVQANVIATSGRAVEAAGDVDVLLLDKTGTITLGNRQASAVHPGRRRHDRGARRRRAARLARRRDARGPQHRRAGQEKYGLRERNIHELGATFTPVLRPDPHERRRRERPRDPQGRGRRDRGLRRPHGRPVPATKSGAVVDEVAKRGGTPLVVADGKGRTLGVIELKDIVKGGIAERFAELRRMGIKTVMITGDNPLTAAAIAAEAGVDDFLAQATPENKLELIREYQQGGRLVAMTGDGTNDAPALAQADVAVAMNTGTQAAKEAGNMVDLDSNPTKLIEVVQIGKQLLMTRGSLTTFTIANDVAKYFAIIPAAFAATYPQLDGAQHHAACNPATRHPVGRDLQRPDHHRPDPAGPARREVRPVEASRAAPQQPADLRPRRPDRAVHRHQARRPASSACSASGGRTMTSMLRPALVLFVLLSVITGVVYPLAITGIAQVVFPHQANGSLIARDGKAVGSSLSARSSAIPKYFWGRLSATSPVPYTAFNADKSTGSSGLATSARPTRTSSRTLKARIDALKAADAAAGYHARPASGPGRSGDRLRQRPGPAHQPRGGGVPGRPRRQGPRPGREPRPRAGRAAHARPASSASSASRASTCWS